MTELRWLMPPAPTPNGPPQSMVTARLQYRQEINLGIPSGIIWSDWIDVPFVVDTPAPPAPKPQWPQIPLIFGG